MLVKMKILFTLDSDVPFLETVAQDTKTQQNSSP